MSTNGWPREDRRDGRSFATPHPGDTYATSGRQGSDKSGAH